MTDMFPSETRSVFRRCEKGRIYFMKSMKRRLLSLFMAMVMVLSLAPGALAEDNEPLPGEGSHKHVWDEGSVVKEATCTEEGSLEKHCTVEGCMEITSETIPVIDHDYVWQHNEYEHYQECSMCGDIISTSSGAHTYTNGVCSVCGREEPSAELNIVVSPKTLTLRPGETGKVTASVTPSGTSVSWESSDPTVAAVSANGVVTALKTGSATITAWAGGGQVGDTCVVTVSNSQRIVISAPGSSHTISTVGGYLQLTATVTVDGVEVSNPDVVWSSSNSAVAEVNSDGYVRAVTNGAATITATIAGTTIRDTWVVNVSNPLTISPASIRLGAYNARDTLTAYFNGTRITSDSVSWSCGTSGMMTNSYITIDNNKNGTATVTALATTPSTGTTVTAAYRDSNGSVYYATATVVVTFSAYNVANATVYTSNSGYNLNDPDDVGGRSIISQLESYFSTTSSRYYGLESVEFANRSDTYGSLNVTTGTRYYVNSTSTAGRYPLSGVVFTPTSKTGTATFSLTAYVYYDRYGYSPTPVSCTITFRVAEGTVSGGDVLYTASVGDTVYFNSGDFADFWDDNYPGGTLESVRFSVSGGTLRDYDGKTVGSKECYANPRSGQIDLSGVYFEPNSSNKKAGTIRFSFTATGYARNSNRTTTRTGTVSIVYLSGSPKDISYSVTTNGSVNLKASDFTAAYREATGNTAPTGMTIVFQSVPRNGTLTYTDSSRSNRPSVRLTSSNIKSYSFTTRSTGSNQIADVSYTGSSGSDTIEYTAYSGNTPQFTGKVVFNGTVAAPTNIAVAFTSTNGSPATFTSAAFTTANANVMARASRVRFTAPGNGSLLLNGAATAVGVDIYPSNLGSVSYRPKAGFNGTDKCLFMVYDAGNTLIGSGTVSLLVQGNAGSTTTTPTTPGAASISQFKDVPATAWYRTELIDLLSKGIVKGKSATSFAPMDKVTYGEALKMVLVAAGHTAQEATGKDWAINYKNLAVKNNWISNDIVLSDPISRNAMAELTAKVLGVPESSAASPFADNANKYAVALYYTTPQIFKGDNATGKLLFKVNDPLLRQEVCAVIYRVNQYYASMNSNQMPDGI